MVAWALFSRQDIKLAQLNIKRLRRRNRVSNAPVVAPGGPVVSLTTFGARLEIVYLTIESIGQGSLLPSRLILWLQDAATYSGRPESLKRLERRGLEVRLTENYGPHSKYYPYLQSTDTFALPLVTADDDVLYSWWWLAGLVEAEKSNPDIVNCYRAHVLQIQSGKIAPYQTWKPCLTTEPDSRNFATGGSGVIYPAKFLETLKAAGSSFIDLCPRADDVWLHVNELRAGLKIKQICNRPLNFPNIPGTQASALFTVNANRGGNDGQIDRTYTSADIQHLLSTTDAPTFDSIGSAPSALSTPRPE